MARVLIRVYHFNSHLREETNKNSISPQQNKKIFQLTSPSGDEREVYSSELVIYIFQLTSPRGDEQKNPREFAPEKIFQITSPFGDEPYLHLHLLPQRQLKF